MPGLPFQTLDLRGEAAHHVDETREIGIGRLQAQLRLVPPRVQARDTGCVLQDAAALLGLGVDDLADLPLPHERGRAGAGRRVLEQDFHVPGTRFRAIDAVG